MKSLKLIIAFIVILGVNIGALYLFTAPPATQHEQAEMPQVEESPAEDSTVAVVPSLPADEAQANMNRWIFALLRDNVTFEEIENVYRQYEAHRDAYRQHCEEKDCKMVEDYHSVKQLIVNGCFDELSKISQYDWNLSDDHKRQVGNVTAYKAREWFMEHYRELKSFADMTAPRTQSPQVPAQKAYGSSSDEKKELQERRAIVREYDEKIRHAQSKEEMRRLEHERDRKAASLRTDRD
ncbi:MAG: hypothetical protein IKW85_04780 [Muribaculaceae bacterium]|nr:hypothetical protein [Muribaculaceae bacterium]